MRFGWHTTANQVVQGIDLTGVKIVITGASSGIGVATADALASAGANLVLGVRNPEKAAKIFQKPAAQVGSIQIEELDLCEPASVQAFSRTIEGSLDCLICNAGVSKTPEVHLPNGLDVRFATNHLGHFLLSHLLRSQLSGRAGRIVMLSSAAHKGNPARLEDLQWQKRQFQFGHAYGESKTCNILFAQEATRRWAPMGIVANAVLPGTALTGLQRFHGDELRRQIGLIKDDGSASAIVKSVQQAAATSVWAATAPTLRGQGGVVLEDCGVAELVGPNTHPWMGFDETVADPDTAATLWEMSVDLLDRVSLT